ncbi:MAG: 3-deoxy-D-manno-octulosonic acid transferase [Paludibacteraceae bacterium]|nr:3-deoxy-D-manno-octulosonic acid transferase [Paludibacteraceae bacterium]
MVIYNLAIRLYKFGIFVASMFNPVIRRMREGERQTISLIKSSRKPGERWVWVHAASLGEFEQGRPLIERIKKGNPEYKVLLTFFSPSGYNVRKNYDKADMVCYLPLDTRSNAKRFVEALRPEKVYIVKYEFWLNYLANLRKNNIETYIISAIFRAQQPFFKWYGGVFRKCLKTFRRLYVQNEESKRLLKGIGVTNVSVTGDTRFDRVSDIAAAAKQLPKVASFAAGHTTIVVGSSWQPDEALLLPYINEHCKNGVRMIIAPHHVEPDRIKELTSMLKCRYILYSEVKDDTLMDADVLVINTIGILSSIYQYGQVAYIGGGFGVGIHNTLEAAVWGMPVVFGPNYKKFKEACELIECGGAVSITDIESCGKALDGYIKDNGKAANAAKEYVSTHIGATDIIYKETIQI